MSWDYDDETELVPAGEGRWTAQVTDGWQIGENPNGGYLVAFVLNAMREVAKFPDPLTITTHFLRPGTAGEEATLEAGLVRAGRTMATTTGSMVQGGKERLRAVAGFADLTDAGEITLSIAPPELPPPDECVSRRQLEQGVELSITNRLDVRIPPDQAVGATSEEAVVSGWVRLRDGRPPDTGVLPLFADGFPPTLFARYGRIGWVPTIELTVHVRRRPAPGWIAGRFECVDVQGDRMVEDGALWDETGALVARSRQIGLIRRE
jgi:acyl-CoA thioesterase